MIEKTAVKGPQGCVPCTTVHQAIGRGQEPPTLADVELDDTPLPLRAPDFKEATAGQVDHQEDTDLEVIG